MYTGELLVGLQNGDALQVNWEGDANPFNSWHSGAPERDVRSLG